MKRITRAKKSALSATIMTTKKPSSDQDVDNFEFNIVGPIDEKPFLGYASSPDKTSVSPQMMIRGSKNVYKKLSGTIAARPGLKLRGAVDATLAKVDSSFEWNTWDGRCLPIRISNSKLQVESDIVTSGTYVWYTLQTSLTKTRYVFDAWWDNTNKKDVLLGVNGSASLLNWSGAIALFVSATATVITLDRAAATAGFSASGSIIISGTTYTYSGVSGSTLTGVSSDVSATAVNTPIFEAIGTTSNFTPASSSYAADFVRVINNRVWVGSYTSRVIYGSKTTSYTDYTQSTPRIPNDGEVITMDDVGKGIGIRQGNPWFASGTSNWYEISFSQITVGATLSEQTKVDKKPIAVLQAALAHEFIDMIGDTLIALCQDQQVRQIGLFADQFETKYPSLSLAVRDELKDETFTTGHLRAIGNIIYITAPNNGRDYMLETREGINELGQITTEWFWHPPQIRNISRFAVIAGLVYGHSNSFPQIYTVWDTSQWHDDSPNATTTGVPYDCIMRLAYTQSGRRQGKQSFDKEYIEGYITQGTKLYGNVYFDYQGATSTSNLDLNSAGDIPTYSGAIAPSLGDASLGDDPLGDGLTVESNDQESLAKFRIIKGVALIDCFEFALEVYTQDLDSRWEVLAIGANATLSESNPIEIMR